MSIWIRRAVLAGISLATGFIITFLEVRYAWQIAGRQFGLGTTFDDFGMVYTFFAIASIAVGTAIILDKFMETEILPH